MSQEKQDQESNKSVQLTNPLTPEEVELYGRVISGYHSVVVELMSGWAGLPPIIWGQPIRERENGK